MKKTTFKAPKGTKAGGTKGNVLGRWGRTEMPSGSSRGGVIGEEAREQDSPLDTYKTPKKRGY